MRHGRGRYRSVRPNRGLLLPVGLEPSKLFGTRLRANGPTRSTRHPASGTTIHRLEAQRHCAFVRQAIEAISREIPPVRGAERWDQLTGRVRRHQSQQSSQRRHCGFPAIRAEPAQRRRQEKRGQIIDASFSALLLGTYSSSAFNAMDSVGAIVEGAIQTNRICKAGIVGSGSHQRRRIDRAL